MTETLTVPVAAPGAKQASSDLNSVAQSATKVDQAATKVAASTQRVSTSLKQQAQTVKAVVAAHATSAKEEIRGQNEVEKAVKLRIREEARVLRAAAREQRQARKVELQEQAQAIRRNKALVDADENSSFGLSGGSRSKSPISRAGRALGKISGAAGGLFTGLGESAALGGGFAVLGAAAVTAAATIKVFSAIVNQSNAVLEGQVKASRSLTDATRDAVTSAQEQANGIVKGNATSAAAIDNVAGGNALAEKIRLAIGGEFIKVAGTLARGGVLNQQAVDAVIKVAGTGLVTAEEAASTLAANPTLAMSPSDTGQQIGRGILDILLPQMRDIDISTAEYKYGRSSVGQGMASLNKGDANLITAGMTRGADGRSSNASAFGVSSPELKALQDVARAMSIVVEDRQKIIDNQSRLSEIYDRLTGNSLRLSQSADMQASAVFAGP